jgi:hypothetical protein
MSSSDDVESHEGHASLPSPPPPPRNPSTSPSTLEPTSTSQQQQPQQHAQQQQHSHSGQKRRRFPVSCYECRRRKLKCDREQPCQRCRSSRRDCIYANEGPASKAAKLGDSPNLPSGSLGYGGGGGGFEDLQPARHRYPHVTGGLPEINNIAPVPHVFERYERYEPAAQRFPVMATDRAAEPRAIQPAHSHTQPLPQIQYFSPGGGHDVLRDSVGRMNSMEQHQVPISRLLSAPEESCPRITATATAMDDHRSVNCRSNCKKGHFVRGKNTKTRYFGKSHISNLLTQFEDLRSFMREAAPLNPAFPQFGKEFRTWKERLNDQIEKEDYSCQHSLNLLDMVPVSSGEVDELVRIYMKMFEATHRIFHIPSFWQEYREFWRDKSKACPAFVAQLLLVMATALLFRKNQSPDPLPSEEPLARRQMAVRWVHAVEVWLSHLQKRDLTLIRIHCLLIIAKRVNCMDVWDSAGTVVRLAMAMGLHRDPDKLSKISVFHAEMRRRLWATILELDLQASMERGMPIRHGNYYDTRPPLNINDWDVMESTQAAPMERSNVTETSFQVQMLKSLPVRLEVARMINSLDPEPPYEEILRLDKELVQCLQDIPHNLKIETHSKVQIEAGLSLPKQLLDLHIRRYLLILHTPFAAQAANDPRYNYSRHVCLENSTIMLSHYKEFTDFTDLRALYFNDEHVQAAITICHETYINKPSAGEFPDRRSPNLYTYECTGLSLCKDMWQLFRDSSLALVEGTLQMLERRVALVGKKGFKDIFFLSMILSYVKAKESPELAERYMKQAADRCARVFQSLPSFNDLLSVRLSPFNDGHELKSQHPAPSPPDSRTEPVVDFVLPVWIYRFPLSF